MEVFKKHFDTKVVTFCKVLRTYYLTVFMSIEKRKGWQDIVIFIKCTTSPLVAIVCVVSVGNVC